MSWLVLVVVLGLALSNGANDNFKGVATIYGSGSASYRVSLAWATATTLAGSLFSLVLAAGLIKTFSGKGLVPDALCPPGIDTQGRRLADEPKCVRARAAPTRSSSPTVTRPRPT